MIQAVVIGSGNVAQHLITAFAKSDAVNLVQVFSRNPEAVSHLIAADQITSDFNSLIEADIYIIAVSDDAIEAVTNQLPFRNKLAVHTSGSQPLNAIDPKNRRGVFYPLQTFSKNKAVDFSTVPICLESEAENDYKILEQVANAISDAVFRISSEQRKALHVAAVFANNFTNHLYAVADEICTENNIPFEILKPLIRETAGKITVLSPSEAQTGPAKRHDRSTIDAHLAFLSDPDRKNMYKILTQSIQNGKKL